jgi:hypothetical protein
MEGVNELALPIGVGLLAAGASLLVRRYVRVVRWSWLAAYIGVVVGASALVWIFVTLDPALYLCAAGLLLFVTLARLPTSVVGIVVFFGVVVIGTIITTIEIIRPPTHLEGVVLTLKNHPPVHAFWIASTSDTIYVAPQVPSGLCQVTGQVVGYPTSAVTLIVLSRSVRVFPPDQKHVGHC